MLLKVSLDHVEKKQDPFLLSVKEKRSYLTLTNVLNVSMIYSYHIFSFLSLPQPYYHSCCSRALNQLNSSIFQISCHN